jgi:hypothetical protein
VRYRRKKAIKELIESRDEQRSEGGNAFHHVLYVSASYVEKVTIYVEKRTPARPPVDPSVSQLDYPFFATTYVSGCPSAK